MAGQLFPVIPRQTFTYAFGGSSSASEVVLLKEMSVVGMREAQLLIRVHKDMAITATEPTVTVKVHAVSPSPDEPGLEFVLGGPANPTILASQTLTAATAKQGALFIKAINLDGSTTLNTFGSHLRIVLSVSAAASGAVTDLTISVDIVAKS